MKFEFFICIYIQIDLFRFSQQSSLLFRSQYWIYRVKTIIMPIAKQWHNVQWGWRVGSWYFSKNHKIYPGKVSRDSLLIWESSQRNLWDFIPRNRRVYRYRREVLQVSNTRHSSGDTDELPRHSLDNGN